MPDGQNQRHVLQRIDIKGDISGSAARDDEFAVAGDSSDHGMVFQDLQAVHQNREGFYRSPRVAFEQEIELSFDVFRGTRRDDQTSHRSFRVCGHVAGSFSNLARI